MNTCFIVVSHARIMEGPVLIIMKPHILFLQKSISTYYNNRLTKQQTKNHEFRPLFFPLILMQRLNSVRFYYIISYFVPAV